MASRRRVEGGNDMEFIDREVAGVDGRQGVGQFIDTLHRLLLKRRHHRVILFLDFRPVLHDCWFEVRYKSRKLSFELIFLLQDPDELAGGSEVFRRNRRGGRLSPDRTGGKQSGRNSCNNQRARELLLSAQVILETGEPRVTTDGLYFWTLSSAVNPNPLPPRVLLRALSDF
jgi:hypothetical protein